MFVKICGITNEDDALLAIALDADALGFVFAPSTRRVDAETVRDIVRRLPREVHTVGVFRNERPERIIEVSAYTIWDQGCGEDCDDCRRGGCKRHHCQQGYPCGCEDDDDRDEYR